MTLEEGASDASALVQSILKKNPENQKDPKDPKDGAPTSPPPQLPKDLPPGYSGQGPRLQDKLAVMVPKELQDSTLKPLDKAKADTNAQKKKTKGHGDGHHKHGVHPVDTQKGWR